MSTSRDRAVSPVLGSVLLVGLTVVLAAIIGGLALADPPAEPPPTARIDCEADVGSDRVACVHRGGDQLDVRDIRLRIGVGGEALSHQPPVPFFAARGFHAGPTGPFNSAADPGWTAGETAAVRLAATNRPGLTPGAAVRIRIVVDGNVVMNETVEAD